jgi:hypothetical protein
VPARQARADTSDHDRDDGHGQMIGFGRQVHEGGQQALVMFAGMSLGTTGNNGEDEQGH